MFLFLKKNIEMLLTELNGIGKLLLLKTGFRRFRYLPFLKYDFRK